MSNLPENMLSVEDTQMIGIAGLAALGQSKDAPIARFEDGSGNVMTVYSDQSIWMNTNISEVYPSVGDYLMDCVGVDDSLTAQLRDWAA
jgi:hypothetical protein